MGHGAKLSNSPRLKRALKALREAGGEISTRDLLIRADICAVNSVIDELRQNGAQITCRQGHEDGQRRFYYTLIKEPDTNNA